MCGEGGMKHLMVSDVIWGHAHLPIVFGHCPDKITDLHSETCSAKLEIRPQREDTHLQFSTQETEAGGYL